MRAVVYDRHGGPEELVVREVADPVPGNGEALVRVRAAGLNGFDPMMLAGSTGLKVPLPMTPCGDAAGSGSGLGGGFSRGSFVLLAGNRSQLGDAGRPDGLATLVCDDGDVSFAQLAAEGGAPGAGTRRW